MNLSHSKIEVLKSIPFNYCCGMSFVSAVLKLTSTIQNDLSKICLSCSDDVAEKFKQIVDSFYNQKITIAKDGKNYVITGDLASLLFDSGVIEKVENEIAIKYGIDEMLLDSECCKKTFLKAIYVCVGKFYHNVDESQNSTGYNLEFNFKDYAIADDVKALLGYFELQFKMNSRKNITTLYTKNSETINNFFVLIDAVSCSLEFQNNLTFREIKNSVNRQNNCYEYNLDKTISASVKQIHAIQYIEKNYGMDILDDDLVEVALLRLANCDLTLNELVQLYGKKITRSGLKYKLDKIVKIYEKLKK